MAPAHSKTPVPRVVSAVEPPTNYYEGSAFVGISVDIVQAIMTELDEIHPIEVYPWARTFTILERGPNVFGFTAGKTQNRIEAGFQFIGPVVSRTHALYSNKPSAARLRDIRQITQNNMKIGGMRGDWRVLFFEEKGIQVEKTSKHVQSLKKLVNGRIDYWVSSDLELSYHIPKTSNLRHTLTPVYEIAHKPSFIIASPQMPKPLLKRWRTAFETLKVNGTLDKIAQKWADKMELPFRYTPERGIHIHKPTQ